MSQHQKTNTLSHLFPFHSLSLLSRPLRAGGARDWFFTGEQDESSLFLVTFLFFKQATYIGVLLEPSSVLKHICSVVHF